MNIEKLYLPPLKRFDIFAIIFLLISIGWAFKTEEIDEKKAVSDRPNIIVMYSDDHTAQAVGLTRGR